MGSSTIRTTPGPISPALATSLAALPAGSFPFVMFRSPLIDLTQTGTTIVPGSAAPGFVFIPSTARVVSVLKTGTCTAGITFKAGNDASNINYIPSASLASSFFSATATPTYEASLVTAAVPTALVDLATPISFVLSSAATGTGGFAWKVYVGFTGFLMPSS